MFRSIVDNETCPICNTTIPNNERLFIYRSKRIHEKCYESLLEPIEAQNEQEETDIELY